MKDELIRQAQDFEEDYAIDEMIEANVEEMKLEYHENLVLLGNLLKEITSQMETKQHNLIKLKEMINS